MWESFRNWDLAPYVILALLLFVSWLVSLPEAKYRRKKQEGCRHTECQKTGENTVYDTDLNKTHTVTLKCLNCEKIIEVKK